MVALYNEIEPFAVAWLRNLITAGQIAPGVVDDRSIAILTPDDLRGVERAHFFAGIGGWDLALNLAGWSGPVWTGSCPCQPFSAAGRRGGTADARHLWPEFFRLIRECRPPVVFGEQVASPDGLAWFDAVSADLEGAGYAVAAADLCAAGVGAPHIRQRLYFVGILGVGLADADITGPQGRSERGYGANERTAGQGGVDGAVADAERDGCGPRRIGGAHGRPAIEPDRHGAARGLPDTAGERRIERGLSRDIGRQDAGSSDGGGLGHADDADERKRVHVRPRQSRQEVPDADRAGDDGWVAHADEPDARDRDESGRGRLVQPALDAVAGGWADAEWVPCSDGRTRPAQSGVHPLAHGVSGRVGRLRGYGNAIVPQVAAAFIRAVMGELANRRAA